MEELKTQVVRLKRSKGEVVQGCDVYVGRRQTQGGWNLQDSIYKNPYPVKVHGIDESMRLYKLHLNALIRQNPNEWIPNLVNLHGKILGCWCKPGPCHGDVLKEYSDQIKVLVDQDLKESPGGKFPRINDFIKGLDG